MIGTFGMLIMGDGGISRVTPSCQQYVRAGLSRHSAFQSEVRCFSGRSRLQICLITNLEMLGQAVTTTRLPFIFTSITLKKVFIVSDLLKTKVPMVSMTDIIVYGILLETVYLFPFWKPFKFKLTSQF